MDKKRKVSEHAQEPTINMPPVCDWWFLTEKEPKKSTMETTTQIRKFQEFFEKHYYAELLEKVRKGEKFLVIDFSDLVKFDHNLADLLLEQPEEVLKAAELSLGEFDLPEDVKAFTIRVKNLPESQKMMIRNIRSDHINKLFWIEGVVRQKSDVRPQVTSSKFECPSCGNIISVLQLDKKFNEPTRCGCGRKGKFRLISKELVDAQGLVLEEAPEDLEGGEQPKRINVFLKKDLVSPISEKRTNPGTKIRLVGQIKEVPIILRSGGQSTRFDLLIDSNYIESVAEEFTELTISPEEMKQIREISQDPKLFRRLVSSIAPSIYGHDRIKEALVLQLVSGCRKMRDDGVVTRGDMHVLLIGDPGSGKSMLLKRINVVAPKSRFISGKGVSGAGLTASVVKDEFLQGWSLEAGALVLANRGICCIDEIDKMSNDDRTAMHEALEGQSYHYDTEINLLDGTKRKIGEIVDNLFQKRKQGIIRGVKTEFMFTKDVKLQSTDFCRLFPHNTQRISRHLAPDYYIEVAYSNGRKIKVTPEHPVYVFKEGIVKEVPAILLVPGTLAPAPRFLKKESKRAILKPVDVSHHNNKKIIFPKNLEKRLSRLIGYMISEGHTYHNENLRYAEIGISNTDKRIIKECDNLIKGVFKTTTNINTQSKEKRKKATKDLFTVRCCSIPLYKFFKENFPELIAKAPLKRIPAKIMCENGNIQIEFLKSAFRGDGFIEKDCFGYSTSSYGMVKDYQDILLQNGMWSFIREEKRGSKRYYKIILSGTKDMQTFLNKIVESNDKRRKRIENISRISKNKQNQRDPIPTDIVKRVDNLLKKLRMSNGYFWSIIRKNQNSKRDVVSDYLSKIEERLNGDKKLKGDINISYCKRELSELKCFVNSDIRFITVKEVKKVIDKSKKYVYDLTVMPNQTFISEGLVLHNTVTISKANIQATLQAQTTVLAAANPKFGRFDPYETVAKQIDMPSTLINRFDLIFPIKDLPEGSKDEKMAKFILNLHQNPEAEKPDLPTNLIRKYIAYAKQNFRPKLSDSAVEEIKNYYLKMRASGSGEGGVKSIPISARQLEGLIRLSEAAAKLRLSNRATKKDARRAINLLNYCLRQIALDEETGMIDIDRIATEIPATQRSKIIAVREIIADLEDKIGKTIPIDDLIRQASEKGVEEDEVEEAIEKLKRSGDIFEPKRGFLSRI